MAIIGLLLQLSDLLNSDNVNRHTKECKFLVRSQTLLVKLPVEFLKERKNIDVLDNYMIETSIGRLNSDNVKSIISKLNFSVNMTCK